MHTSSTSQPVEAPLSVPSRNIQVLLLHLKLEHQLIQLSSLPRTILHSFIHVVQSCITTKRCYIVTKNFISLFENNMSYSDYFCSFLFFLWSFEIHVWPHCKNMAPIKSNVDEMLQSEVEISIIFLKTIIGRALCFLLLTSSLWDPLNCS